MNEKLEAVLYLTVIVLAFAGVGALSAVLTIHAERARARLMSRR